MNKRMMTLVALIALAGLTFGGTLGAAPLRDGDGMTLMARLSGAAEVPGPGDPDGTGMATVTANADDEICFELNVSNITLPAAAAHIHEGAADVAGPVVVTLAAPDANGKARGCVEAEEALIEDIFAHPANYYVNVHTSDYPAGAVRGQLAMASASLPDTGVSSTGTLLLVGAALLTLLAGVGVRHRVQASAR